MTTSPETSARDELAEIIDRDVHYYGIGTFDVVAAADAILAAGYRKPRTITTVEELDALPERSVVRDATTDVLERLGGRWYCGDFPGLAPTLPATVLWEPEA